MKVCVIAFGLLVACALSYALETEKQGPLLAALAHKEGEDEPHTDLVTVEQINRPKRGLLLGD